LLPYQSIRVVIFDLDGTLRHSRPTFNQKFFEIVARFGVPGSPARRRQSMRWLHYYWAQSPELLADRERFNGLEDGFWTNHVRLNLIAYGCSLKQAEQLTPLVYHALAEEFQPDDWVPPDVPDTLGYLRRQGYQLGLLTNRSQPCQEDLERLGLLEYFSLVVAAGEIDTWKPNAGIFLYSLEQLEARPEETLYVGDNYYADVLGARRAGLHTLLVDPEDVFPDVDCVVIKQVGELQAVLGGQ